MIRGQGYLDTPLICWSNSFRARCCYRGKDIQAEEIFEGVCRNCDYGEQENVVAGAVIEA